MNKILFILTLLSAFFQSTLPGQEKAYLKVINLIDTGQPTTMILDGYKLKRGKPVPVGFTSGALGVAPGPHSVQVENDGAERSKMNVALDLVPGTSYGVVCFSDVELKKDKDGEEIEVHKLKFTVLSGNDDTNKAKLTIFSLTKREVTEVRIKGRPYRIAPKRPVKVDVNVGEIVEVLDMADNEIGGVEIISAFHYVGFIDDKSPDGKLRFTFFEQRSYAGGDIVIQEEEEQPPEKTRPEEEISSDEELPIDE